KVTAMINSLGSAGRSLMKFAGRFVASIAARPVILILSLTLTAAVCECVPFPQAVESSARDTLAGQLGTVNSIVFRPDGAMFASVGGDGSILLWNNAAPPSIEPMLQAPQLVRFAAFSPDSRMLAVSSAFAPVSLLDFHSRCWRELEDSTG